MTEAEWLACNDPRPMLEFLRGKVSDRKLRFFAVASCKRVDLAGLDTRLTNLLHVGEQLADGVGSSVDYAAVIQAAEEIVEEYYLTGWDYHPGHWETAEIAYSYFAGQAFLTLTSADAFEAALHAPQAAVEYAKDHALVTESAEGVKTCHWRVAESVEKGVIASLLRDVVGNPFRANPLKMVRITPNVRKIVETVYRGNSFDRLPILADALEEAGCDNADILNHCRQLGEHVRGCWVIDALLGKE